MINFSNQLLIEAEAAFFSTIDENSFPHTRALFNLRNKEQFPELSKIFKDHKNDLLLYFSTNTSSAKISHIKSNPAVSVCYCIPKDFRGLTCGGNVEIVTDKKIKKTLWLDWWIKYYPKGVDDEDYTILKLVPKTIEIWYKGKYKFDFS